MKLLLISSLSLLLIHSVLCFLSPQSEAGSSVQVVVSHWHQLDRSASVEAKGQ